MSLVKPAMIRLLALVALLAFCLLSCSGPSRTTTSRPLDSQFVRTSYLPSIFNISQGLCQQLEQNFRDGTLAETTCTVTTIVDIDDLASTSTFGRLLSEAIGAELMRKGAKVVDIRTAKAFMTRNRSGELILTRNAEDLSGSVKARAVVAGTYGVSRDSVVVTVRLISLSDSRIMSVAMTELARTPELDSLLSKGLNPEPTAYDRMF